MTKKIGLHTKICPNLHKIMKQHCKCENIPLSHYISDCIAKQLKIPLNQEYLVDEKYLVDYEIKEIENCINKLEEKKTNLLKRREME